MNNAERLAVLLIFLLVPAAVMAYPLDGYEETGIRRVEGARLAQEGKALGGRQPPGGLLTTEQVDLRLLDKPDLARSFTEGVREAFRQGIRGANHEAGLYTRLWGFSSQEVTAEVRLWHGEQDNNVPISTGRYVGGLIPNCQSTFLRDEGHFTLPRRHVRAILSTLIS